MNVRELTARLDEIEKDWDYELGDFQDLPIAINFILGEDVEELEEIDIQRYRGVSYQVYLSKESEGVAKELNAYISLS